MTRFLLFIFFTCIGFQCASQIKGHVTDDKNTPLSLVNIYVENTYNGTTSNEEGNYELNITDPKTYIIIFQFLGYKSVKKTVTIESFPYTLDVTLSEENISLNEVVINSNENPAKNIIQQTIAKRKYNLEKIQSYKANFYSRGLLRIKNAPEKILGQEIGDLGGDLDSTRSGVVYLSETISKIEFLRPHKLKEKITASKVSGNDNGFSFNTASDADHDFYNNTIELGTQILSPIATNALGYYNYKLEGVFYDDKDHLINKIKVIPKRKNDAVFSGYIYIVENQWTIYALELSVTGIQAHMPSMNSLTFKQSFSYSEKDTVWAKISQNLDFVYGILGIKGDGRFTAVYSDYVFNQKVSRKKFGKEILYFADEANKKDSIYWNSVRPVPLTNEEISDYIKKDSLQVIRKSKTYLDSIDHKKNTLKLGNLISGYNYSNTFKNWNFGIISPISVINFNTVQGWNANVDLYYRKSYVENKKLLAIRSNFNYGFSDNRLRGSLTASYKFNNTSRPYVTLSGGVVTEQFNASKPISNSFNTGFSLFSEKNYLKIYEKTFTQFSFSSELFNGFWLNSSLAYERRKPLFNTTDQTWYPQDNRVYTSNNPLDATAYGIAPFQTHNIIKLSVYAKINFSQNYMSYPVGKFNVPNEKYPVLFVGYENGFGATNPNYNFNLVKARLTQGFDIGNKGRFEYNLKSGTFFNADGIAFMDYQHFNGNQTHIGEGTYLNVFNNAPYYSLSTNDSYLELHAEHDFNGFLLGKIPLLNKLNFNLIIGGHALSTPNNVPYQEYTIGIDNIGWGKFRFLRLDYVRSYQSGFQSDAILFGLKFF